MELAVSILGVINNQEKIDELAISQFKYFHLDVMDGRFVSNVALPYNNLHYSKPVDIHLMAYDIEKYLTYYRNLDIAFMTFHYEIGNVDHNIDLLKKHNIKVGLAVNPDTNLEEILPYLNKIDLLLIMSVVPGKGGQPFIAETYNRISYIKDYRTQNNLSFLISVDGGINDQIYSKLDTDITVVGNYITSSDNFSKQIEKLVTK